jgi:putative transposase
MRGEWDVSIRRACGVFEMDISTSLVAPDRQPSNSVSERFAKRAFATAMTDPRLLRREDWCHGQNETRRVYRELGLQFNYATRPEAPGQGEAA